MHLFGGMLHIKNIPVMDFLINSSFTLNLKKSSNFKLKCQNLHLKNIDGLLIFL